MLFLKALTWIILILILIIIIIMITIIIIRTVDKKHDRVCAQIHFNLYKETGVQLDKEHWNEHVPKSVETSQEGKLTILWNQQIQADRTIPNNSPDIRVRDNEKGTCMLIDAAVSGDRCD